MTDIVAGPVAGVRARRALLALLLGDPDLIFRQLWKRDDLLDIHENSTVVVVRLEARTADVDATLDEPEGRCRQLASELGRRQDDPHVLRESILIGFVHPRKSSSLARASASALPICAR